jgi:hypothetical protein
VIGNERTVEADSTVRPIAERLVSGLAAAAQHHTLSALGPLSARIGNRHPASDHIRSVRCGNNLAAGDRISGITHRRYLYLSRISVAQAPNIAIGARISPARSMPASHGLRAAVHPVQVAAELPWTLRGT